MGSTFGCGFGVCLGWLAGGFVFEQSLLAEHLDGSVFKKLPLFVGSFAGQPEEDFLCELPAFAKGGFDFFRGLIGLVAHFLVVRGVLDSSHLMNSLLAPGQRPPNSGVGMRRRWKQRFRSFF